jgi:hypothetical protein
MINEKNTHIVNLSSYTSPSITEVKNDNYVEYGDNNDYFNYLIERITGSSTNGAIIKGISNLIYGKGLAATDAENRTSEWIKIMTYFRPSDLRKIIYDRKALGMAAIQVLYKKGKVVGTEHFPMQTLRPTKKDKFGKIKTWLYFNDWKNKKKSDEAEPIAAFGEGNGNEPEIYIWQGYVSGFEYFQPPEYIASLPYALLEEEIADYLINDAQNGFSPTTLLNFNNGVPEDQDKRRDLADEATKKLSGSKGKKLVITFNENKDHKATIDSIPLNDAPAHYEYLSKECFNKLIVGHSVTSPMLLGIRDGQSGLGNNADEIKNATLLFENIVIRVYQNQLIDIIKEICPTSLDLYFKTIQPLDFMQVDEPLSDDEEEKQTGVEMSKQEPTDEDLGIILNDLEGETISDEWELVESREYKEENGSVDIWANEKIQELKTTLTKLADIIKSKPSGESVLDKSFYKVRYEYNEKYSSANSRDFCKQMMRRTGSGVVYRLEDIDKASRQGVNRKFGHKGQDYDLFKYKGGPKCGHFWNENLYRLKKKTNGDFVEDKALSSSEEVNSIPKSYLPRPAGHKKAKIAPRDMPNQGHHPNFKP